MNFTNTSLSHGVQFFTNCSSVGPFHRVQPFRNRLLQCGSSMGSRVLPANLLQHGLLSMGPQVLPGACSSLGSPQGHSLLWASTCAGVGSSTGCRRISATPLPSMGCRGTACLTMVFTTGCRGISALVPGAPPPLLLHWPRCLQGCSSHTSSLLSPAAIAVTQGFFCLLKYIIPVRYHCH